MGRYVGQVRISVHELSIGDFRTRIGWWYLCCSAPSLRRLANLHVLPPFRAYNVGPSSRRWWMQSSSDVGHVAFAAGMANDDGAPILRTGPYLCHCAGPRRFSKLHGHLMRHLTRDMVWSLRSHTRHGGLSAPGVALPASPHLRSSGDLHQRRAGGVMVSDNRNSLLRCAEGVPVRCAGAVAEVPQTRRRSSRVRARHRRRAALLSLQHTLWL